MKPLQQQTTTKPLLTKYSTDFADEFTPLFTHQTHLTPTCIEALTNYIHNQKYIVQEVVHPNGQIEHHKPLQPDLCLADCDNPQFLYTVLAIEIQIMFCRKMKVVQASCLLYFQNIYLKTYRIAV